ncbi:2,3-dihydroxybiphenyl-1,2-dioxygenase [Mycolicibacterium canariasense]|uniref:2,3-dihydroxybiphenyl-1,2-dioxygenase n=1 Tax=Mycolicibacterium canariasense TaxID=228230 RepID=A0A100W8T1_MYCCR|nr:VOC family protein [Mycolicibacterium canariasense]MCV7212879.1 VOC family protein [Mycolicibacterium canariasense]ORV19280.1 2,3-dihydroxybiphenyl 1,2-dioxygenase [Mycolicibacterium canariasense]GAS93851.1 2,3-dihydroxybiphenyl-1,2-dioxygenase [Mycolicibacterium canariasense]
MARTVTRQTDRHSGLHSEQGALRGEHPGRSRDPIIRVADIAWLEFDKPDLVRAEAFARAFGFGIALRDPQELHLRGTAAGAPCVILRRGQRTRFSGLALRAADEVDVLRLADKTGARLQPLPESVGGVGVQLTEPSGTAVTVVAGLHTLPAQPAQEPQVRNTGNADTRINATVRPPRVPARVQRLGHVVLQSTTYLRTLNWYLDMFGMIVSDFLFFPGQRDRGPAMSFIRCDRGSEPADHHTLALALGPANRYIHSAYEVSDLDALAAGGEYLRERGYFRSWGIGRHIQGSQLFDYWRDPDGFLVEHFADGDVFDNTLEPGWAPFTASGLAQWGPPATKDFLDASPRAARHQVSSMLTALRGDNEFDLNRLIGLLKVAAS